MKIRIILSLSIIVFNLVLALGQANYTIKGTTSIDTMRGNVLLSTFDPIKQEKTKIAETTINADGTFEVQYSFVEPDLLRIDFPDRVSQYLAVNHNQNMIIINIDKSKQLAVDGSEDTKKLIAYDEFRKSSNHKWVSPTYDAMSAASKKGDQDGEIAAVEAYVKNSKIHRKELIEYTEREIGTSVALYGTALRWTGDDEIGKLDNLVNNFAKKYPNLKMTKQMLGKVARYKKVAIGAKAADINGQDLDGNDISLYGSLGKYTLIDFWASWCGPCILQIPDLQKVYTKFHDQGFEIFSYSVDRSEKKWLEAAAKYDMPWVHGSDIKGWQSQVAADYNVTFVPFNFLLDENGNIIAKNLHHKTLYNFLDKLFDDSESGER